MGTCKFLVKIFIEIWIAVYNYYLTIGHITPLVKTSMKLFAVNFIMKIGKKIIWNRI